MKAIADEIVAAGGRAEAAVVDATNPDAVNNFVDAIVHKAGTLDLSYCAIDFQVVQNVPLVQLSVEDFVRPVSIAMQSHFLTATAAGKIMLKQHSGVILSVTATPGGIGYPYTAGFAPACAAIESFSRNLAAELGAYGVRVVNLRSGGSPDSKVFREAIELNPKNMEFVLRGMENDTMLKRLPLLEDVATTALFLASDLAKSITGVTVDVTEMASAPPITNSPGRQDSTSGAPRVLFLTGLTAAAIYPCWKLTAPFIARAGRWRAQTVPGA